jgi:YbgC/YbaW family acyl-CoA thioester hydrolase
MAEIPSIETREEVMFFDTDCGGVVHNIAYLRMIETCRTRLAAKLGMALKDMAQSQLFPVVVRTEIDYRRPAVLGDELVIHGRLECVERARFWCAFEMKRANDSTQLITCRQQLALVQMPEGRPMRLPADWSLRYAHLKKNLAPLSHAQTSPQLSPGTGRPAGGQTSDGVPATGTPS